MRRALPSEADADDLLQDSYVRFLKAREKGAVRSPKALLFAIARNVVRDFFHKKAMTEIVPITETNAMPVLQGDEGLVESVCRAQELELLAEAIQALPERCREVILLRKIRGQSQREIAALLGIAEHTVESLATKGVHRCAEYLRARGIGPSSERADRF